MHLTFPELNVVEYVFNEIKKSVYRGKNHQSVKNYIILQLF